MEKIAQGAEAILWREDGKLVKERVKKGYRLPELDKRLRKARTSRESSMMREARRAGVSTPTILEESEDRITMDFIEGSRVKEALSEASFKEIGAKIGAAVAILHSHGIIHGDLTTSNMILRQGDLYLIDFGLSFRSKKSEDMAVDLWLLRHAVESTHWDLLERLWSAILEAYRKNFGEAEKTIKTLSRIEKRGRYKSPQCD